MNRRAFLAGAGALLALGAGTTAVRYWPENGLTNPCRPGPPPPDALNHPLVRQAFDGIDFSRAWDMHAHLAGLGDSGSGVWVNPRMYSPFHPVEYLQRLAYLNAGCAETPAGTADEAYMARLTGLLAAFPAGYKLVLFAFDRYYDPAGRPIPDLSQFYVPNRYAAETAARHPERLEWAASVHPYRRDWREELDYAVAHGARAVKWLPSSMGIDPADPRCDPFYRSLAETGLPLVSHAGLELAALGAQRQELGNPLRLRRALDQGVRVVVAHCASQGHGRDGPDARNFDLFARLMDEPRYETNLYADISGLTQVNRLHYLPAVLERIHWHPRLLNGSDYPLPGVMPLYSAKWLARKGLIPSELVAPLTAIRAHNPLVFDFVLKRHLAWQGKKFPASVFETRPFFDTELSVRP